MKFMKLAQGLFHKFHIKWQFRHDPLFNMFLWHEKLPILWNQILDSHLITSIILNGFFVSNFFSRFLWQCTIYQYEIHFETEKGHNSLILIQVIAQNMKKTEKNQHKG